MQAEPSICFMPTSCLVYSSALKVEATCSSIRKLTFNILHGVTSQKTEFFNEQLLRLQDCLRAWITHSIITDNGQNNTDKTITDNMCY
jgi:hypothetical protein